MITDFELISTVGRQGCKGAAGGTGPAAGCVPAAPYPLRLASPVPSEQTLVLWRQWGCPQTQGDAAEPWLPVGHCGPLLLLGHHAPAAHEAPLPFWCFQAVLLTVEDYDARLAWLRREYQAGAGHPAAPDNAWKPLRPLPEHFIRPASPRAAAQFLLEYFPNSEAAAAQLRALVTMRGGSMPELPAGYEAALAHVLGQGPVVDLGAIRLCDPGEAECRPEALRGQSLVAVRGRRLWLAAAGPRGAHEEDRLLDELGDGWQVTLLWSVAEQGAVPRAGAEGSAEGCRERIVIESAPVRRSGAGGEGFVPGEIVLTEAMIRQLEAYDPRRPDRDPAKVFLRELSAAIRCGASDLHIEPGVDGARIWARVDGVMEEWLGMGADFGQAVVGAAKELAGLPAERFVPQDGCCTILHGASVVGARVSSYPIRRRRQKLVLRLLPRRGQVPAVRELLPPWQAGLLLRAAACPQGLVLVCGPTGSGKTTTLFSVLSSLNTPVRNIMTMEDPVEYEVEGLNQAELDPLRGATWDALLRGFLRQDPDAGLLGEIRDRETAEIAVRQALTGHLVFATLHTLSCARTLERLTDMGVNPDTLASALSLVVSQRLLRRLCPRCRCERAPAAAEQDLFRRHKLPSPPVLFEPSSQGCAACRRGFKGRVAAVEMLPVVDEVVQFIETRSRARVFDAWMLKEGLPSVFSAALSLVAAGETSLGEAMEWQPVWSGFEWRAQP